MAGAIGFVDDRPVSFRHGMLHRGRGRAKVTLERRPLLEGEYLLLTLPQTAVQRSEKRCLKRACRLLRDTPASALCWSGQTALMAPALLGGLLNGASLRDACDIATEFTWRTIETTFEKSPDHRFGPKFECHLPWLAEKMETCRKMVAN